MSASPVLSFIQGIGGPELLVIFLIVLLFFGARRLPELARGLGKSMKEFKKATQDVQDDFREAMDSVDPNKPDTTTGRKPSPPRAQKAETETETTKSNG